MLALRLCAALTLACLGVGAAAGGLEVRPVLSQRGARPDAARPAPVRATPDDSRARWLPLQEKRVAAWRRFDDHLGAPGIDWSSRAARRVGFRPDAAAPRDPRLAAHGNRTDIEPETLRVAIVRIDFTNDRGGSASSGNGRFDVRPADPAAPPLDRTPHDRQFYLQHLEALRRYYRAQSYGRVEVVGDVWPRQVGQDSLAYSISDMADLGPWTFGQGIYRAAVHMFRSMLFAANQQAIALGDSIPWRTIDRVIIVHAGSDLQSDLRQDSKLDIPTFTLGVADSDRVVFPDSAIVAPPDPDDPLARYRPIDRAAFIPETITQDGFYGVLNAVLAHECGHLFFGFADLYDVESGFPVVGFWSLMDSGNLAGAVIPQPNGDEIFAVGLLPPSIDPFQRFFATDALEFPEVSFSDTTRLLESERHPDMRSVTLTSDEYLLLENRWITPFDTLELDQDPTTHVILGPKTPDRLEYDSLLPGSGVLVWHIDTSVIPFEGSLRVNPDLGFNSNFRRLGISVIEADALADLGDPGSPFLLGSYRDPWYRSNNPSLSDTTEPSLIPNLGTRPHVRLDFLTEPDDTMKLVARRVWQLPAFPLAADFPPGGPQLLAVDADGNPSDPGLEICWAGGGASSGDSTALFAVKRDGTGLTGSSYVMTNLDVRPRPLMAAIPIGGGGAGPSLFAVSTYPTGPDLASPGGRVWLFDHTGQPMPGWPAMLPALVTTPPVIAGTYPQAMVFVGCDNGSVYAIDLDGTVHPRSTPVLAGGIHGRLAVADVSTITTAGGALASGFAIAAGGGAGDVAVFTIPRAAGPATGPALVRGWPQRLASGPGFEPDFLWIDFDGRGAIAGNPSGCGAGRPELVVHHTNRLWGYCAEGLALAGWIQPAGDSLVASLGAGDPDGDGYPEVLTQTLDSRVAFRNLSGYASPGWPRAGSSEGVLEENPDATDPRPPRRFPTGSPALALDVDGDGRCEIVALNTSGSIAALRGDGSRPEGWPLGTGAGTGGAPVAADLDRDGTLELVAPDRFGALFAFSLPVAAGPLADPWPMLAGDPGRTSALPAPRMANTPAPSPGLLVQGSLKAFPNPARRRPVSFAYQLNEPAQVEFRILDASGHEVASFERSAQRSDNLVVWDPGGLPAGLYLARLRFRGAGHEDVQVLPLGLIR